MSETDKKSGCNCGCMGAGPLLSELVKRLGPSGAVGQHFRNAQLEVLKGLRALIDEQISSQSGAGPQHHGTKISVE